ncbi:hypothetical protein EJ08DRAFT_672714 [Tothia fuscella]|uniref:ceramidase n=1 Tax=Tothia fuscella TaxID=1048955 RepID=A0A9P4NIT3_9PEZI|nr:hypothetical protein EJ08DRAFT_672714 [Tothia fuscella]
MSLPPSQRYIKVATDFRENVKDLITLFDEVVLNSGTRIPLSMVKSLARIFLRCVHSTELTEELRGISKAIGVEMYLLVAYNVLLDLFMGCTSGGVRVRDEDGERMLHFRTLDWEMDVLRKVVVQYEFVNRPGGQVIARGVGYVGFVGCLTGVRKDLSVSLNFRACHNNSGSWRSNFKYYGNQLAILLGFRPSIASILRSFILPTTTSQQDNSDTLSSLTNIAQTLPSTPTTACYITLNDGDRTAIFEKDRTTSKIRSSQCFASVTNHDSWQDEWEDRDPIPLDRKTHMIDLDFLEESVDRKQIIDAVWRKAARKYKRENPGKGQEDASITQKQLEKWTGTYPTANECTHYAAIMDPTKGEIVWCRRWKEPISGP